MKNERIMPSAKPGQVTKSGSKRTRTSVIANTTIRQEKRIHFPASAVRPKRKKQPTKRRPVSSSMSGYIGEMGSLQQRHFPPSQSHPRMGTLSYGLMGVRQRGQRDPGDTMETPSGMRVMHTFRKLPITMPSRKK